jgi:hypothetical protein
MRDQLDFFVVERTESHARILLAPREGAKIAKIAGVVRGPFSEFSKTLTADSTIRPGMTEGTFEALVVEPCYWTPALPFWYDLRLILTFADGVEREEIIPVGIKRFYCERRNFLVEGKRIVLRGMQIDSADEAALSAARNFETALIVNHANDGIYASANRLGVALVVDLRGAEWAACAELDWHPAVMLVLVGAEQVADDKLRNVQTAVCVNATSEQPTVACDAYAIELQPGERPPAWATTCDKPVIVIRKDPNAKIRDARAGCDKLQAELAPEFDLAGYFV